MKNPDHPGRQSKDNCPADSDSGAEHTTTEKGLGSRIRARFAPLGGIELELPPREPIREPPRFE